MLVPTATAEGASFRVRVPDDPPALTGSKYSPDSPERRGPGGGGPLPGKKNGLPRAESGPRNDKTKGGGEVLRWYDWTNTKTGATIITKGRWEAEARLEAADRMNCDDKDLICTAHWPVNHWGNRW